jgi:ketol-acid reductoisomerase
MTSPSSSFSPLPVFTDQDCNLEIIRSKKMAIIGYGSQGHAHALNLRESGVQDIIIGLREHSPSALRAREAGLIVQSPAQVAAEADIVMIMAPDEHQADIYRDDLEKNLKKNAALGFAHGLNVHFGLIKPRPDLDVFMVAPKGPGYALRHEFQHGRGLPSLIAVAQNATGAAHDITLSYAAAIGSGRSGIIETTFKDECETDLFGEQTVLCGGISALIKAGYETLVEAGYPPEMAYFECVHEAKLVVDLIYQHGLANMRHAISNTAEYGDYTRGPRIINDATRAEMKKILCEIQSGQFAQEFMGGNKEGLLRLRELRKEQSSHPVEAVGQHLRSLMPWISTSTLVDKNSK